MMTRVTLLIPPGMSGTTPNHEGASGMGAVEPGPGGFRYAPQTLAAVAATLRGEGLAVSVCDAPALGDDAATWATRLAHEQPDVLAVLVSWATSQSDAAFLERLREAGVRAPVVAFGASTRWMLPALRLADHILLGEPELALPHLCRRLAAADRDLPQCIEVGALDPARHTPNGLIADLDALPLPVWDWVTTERYNHLSILSSRGCSVGCAWCPYVVAQGNAYRACSPERTVTEMRELVTRYGARQIGRAHV